MTITVAQIKEWIQVLNAAGLLGMLVFIVYAGFKGWWEYGRNYRSMEERAKAAESLNKRAILVAHKLLVDAEQEDH